MRHVLVVLSLLTILCSALVIERPCCAKLRHIHARFGRRVTNSDEYTRLEVATAVPIQSCAPLRNDLHGKIALVKRGGCNFSYKVLNAQRAHAKAVIVYDDYPRQRNESWAIRMVPDHTNSSSVFIPSVFVSHESGDRLLATIDIMASVNETLLVTLNSTGEILPLATPAAVYQESLETSLMYFVLAIVCIAIMHWLQRT
ncbi:hypothetical protein THRCLA_23389 [Thraustotheca clavata]|uniref:PA domain-containing protein n=1 Tax=Thraustotheca clavata TaxID=74557 RepID=A0A1V9Y6L8_9STRA|nr:hypothetical protein THRCLA_23389 [Thraustotheca clavata]